MLCPENLFAPFWDAASAAKHWMTVRALSLVCGPLSCFGTPLWMSICILWVGAFSLAPHCFIAVDVTHARTPDSPKEETFPAGGGTVIGIGPNMTRWMTDRLITKAEARGIPWSPEVMTGHSGTNAWRVQVAREGIATAVVSLPLKYMHSPVETLDLDDLEHSAALLAAFVQDLAREGGEFLAD